MRNRFRSPLSPTIQFDGNGTNTGRVNKAMLHTYTPAADHFASIIPAAVREPGTARKTAWRLGPNDGGIQRGDREETGDNEARPTEKGSGDAHKTVDDTAFGGTSSIRHPSSSHFDLESEREDLDGIEIMEADDGRLGLTNTDRVPADDWAANTGNTAVPDGEE